MRTTVHNTVQLWTEQKGRCKYCNHSMILGDKYRMPTIEHIITQSEGGKDRLDNLCLACWKCNNYRGSIPLEQFLDGYREAFAHSKDQSNSTTYARKVRGPKRWYHGNWIVW